MDGSISLAGRPFANNVRCLDWAAESGTANYANMLYHALLIRDCGSSFLLYRLEI